jgi:chemotaxis protein CheD
MDSESPVVRVKMAEYRVAASPAILRTAGIGSCIVILLHEPGALIGGLAHALLPKAPENESTRPARYMDTAVWAMLGEIKKHGGDPARIQAKIVGGAHMFSALEGDQKWLGRENAKAAKDILEQLNIPIVATLTGGSAGRTVELEIATGRVQVTTTI